jgi:hypothetical protein
MNTITYKNRETALLDRVLYSVNNLAAEAGLLHPTAISSRLNDLVDAMPSWNDRTGRIWDIVWMMVRLGKKVTGNVVTFPVILQDSEGNPNEYTLKGEVSDSNGSPVITIMLEDEELQVNDDINKFVNDHIVSAMLEPKEALAYYGLTLAKLMEHDGNHEAMYAEMKAVLPQ